MRRLLLALVASLAGIRSAPAQSCEVLGGTVDAALFARACPADCDADGRVTVDELLLGVKIDLGRQDLHACARADADGDGQVGVHEVIAGINSALDGCYAPTATFDGEANVNASGDRLTESGPTRVRLFVSSKEGFPCLGYQIPSASRLVAGEISVVLGCPFVPGEFCLDALGSATAQIEFTLPDAVYGLSVATRAGLAHYVLVVGPDVFLFPRRGG